MLQPRTMKRADAAQTANPASRPEKPGKMKSQRFSSPLTVRPLTVVAIDGLAAISRLIRRHLNERLGVVARVYLPGSMVRYDAVPRHVGDVAKEYIHSVAGERVTTVVLSIDKVELEPD